MVLSYLFLHEWTVKIFHGWSTIRNRLYGKPCVLVNWYCATPTSPLSCIILDWLYLELSQHIGWNFSANILPNYSLIWFAQLKSQPIFPSGETKPEQIDHLSKYGDNNQSHKIWLIFFNWSNTLSIGEGEASYKKSSRRIGIGGTCLEFCLSMHTSRSNI